MPKCVYCMDGCGGFPDSPVCWDEHHTRVVDGVVLNICDMGGGTAYDGQICDPGTYNNQCVWIDEDTYTCTGFHYIEGQWPWDVARTQCTNIGHGWDLSILRDKYDFDKVVNGKCWIGLTDKEGLGGASSGDWRWLDGSADYFVWMDGQPDNWEGAQDCVYVIPGMRERNEQRQNGDMYWNIRGDPWRNGGWDDNGCGYHAGACCGTRFF